MDNLPGKWVIHLVTVCEKYDYLNVFQLKERLLMVTAPMGSYVGRNEGLTEGTPNS